MLQISVAKAKSVWLSILFCEVVYKQIAKLTVVLQSSLFAR